MAGGKRSLTAGTLVGSRTIIPAEALRALILGEV